MHTLKSLFAKVRSVVESDSDLLTELTSKLLNLRVLGK